MGEILFIVCGPGVALLVVQLVIIRLTRRRFRPLRFLSLLALLIPLVLAAQYWLEKPSFWGVGIVFSLIMAGLMLVGWVFAWIGAVGEHKDKEQQE